MATRLPYRVARPDPKLRLFCLPYAGGSAIVYRSWPRLVPDWIEICRIDHGSKGIIDFPMIQDRAALMWVVNLGCIDLNQWYARCDDVGRPDYVHFDLQTALIDRAIAGGKTKRRYGPRERGPLSISRLCGLAEPYFATKPASVINCELSLSSSSRNFTISGPERKIGFSACFSM